MTETRAGAGLLGMSGLTIIRLALLWHCYTEPLAKKITAERTYRAAKLHSLRHHRHLRHPGVLLDLGVNPDVRGSEQLNLAAERLLDITLVF